MRMIIIKITNNNYKTLSNKIHLEKKLALLFNITLLIYNKT